MTNQTTERALAIGKAVADRCHGTRKPGTAMVRYETIRQAAVMGAQEVISAALAQSAVVEVDELGRSPAQFFFEVGFGACWAEAFIRNGEKAPFELSDAIIERAWEIAPEAHDDPEEFDRMLALAAAPPAPASASGWRHIKRGTAYVEIGRAELQADVGPFEGDILVIYRGEDGKLWAREQHEFEDGRFEPLPSPPRQGVE